ncbi:hypothetical protein RF11_11116 [Thelohanellus kitauei]|uniref:Uncharacterized protein n=1 Tax=Thelohanellus kitauei TaxID=669202 RepID=A0A0C2MZA2_THEKT|nr:hypothetical protein RF11_11116 [Thelohanellus kitauei]
MTDSEELVQIKELYDTWEYVKKLYQLFLTFETSSTGVMVSEFIPSLIWSHLRGIVEKIAPNHLREETKKFSSNSLREALYTEVIMNNIEDDKERMKLWTIPDEEASKKDSFSSRLSDTSSIFNSLVIDVDKNVKGLENLPPQLKYIPLGHMKVYSQLIDIVCTFSKSVSNECLLRLFRLIHLLCRVGYPPNTFDELSLFSTKDLQFILNPNHVRITLTNYLVERFSFLILRAVYLIKKHRYRGFVNEGNQCAKDLHNLSIRQHLFISSTVS